MKVTITIDAGANAAFEQCPGDEVARILREYLASDVEGLQDLSTLDGDGLRDINGNRVGAVGVQADTAGDETPGDDTELADDSRDLLECARCDAGFYRFEWEANERECTSCGFTGEPRTMETPEHKPEPVLELDPEGDGETDYLLPENYERCWITLGNVSVSVRRIVGADVVEAALYKKGDEGDGDPLALCHCDQPK
jgi:hypothetical protein